MLIKIDEKLELKQLKRTDAKEVFTAIDSQRRYLGKWLAFVAQTKKLADTENFITSVVDAPEDEFNFVFTIRKENKFIGLIGFNNTDRLNKKTQLGYWLLEEFQQEGIMTRSVEKLCQFAFNQQNLNKIEIKCASGNTASKKIAKRLNFKFEGIERQGLLVADNNFTHLEVYSKLKSD